MNNTKAVLQTFYLENLFHHTTCAILFHEGCRWVGLPLPWIDSHKTASKLHPPCNSPNHSIYWLLEMMNCIAVLGTWVPTEDLHINSTDSGITNETALRLVNFKCLYGFKNIFGAFRFALIHKGQYSFNKPFNKVICRQASLHMVAIQCSLLKFLAGSLKQLTCLKGSPKTIIIIHYYCMSTVIEHCE